MRLYYSDVLMPRKVCALARHLRSPAEFVYLDLGRGEHKTPAYRAIQPLGKVPALVDGDRVLWESDAILVALAQDAGSPLWPDGAAQSEIVRWFSFNAHHFNQPCGMLYFEYVIKPRFNLGPPDQEAVAKGTDLFRQTAPVIEAQLAGRRWLLGDDLSLADFSVANPLAYAGKVPYPLDDFPQIRRWTAQLADIDAWRDAFPPR